VAEAVRLSRETGAPVQVIWTREDDIRHDFYRPTTYNRFRAGLDANGVPSAWSHHIVGASISLSKHRELENGIDGSLVEGAANLPYAIPNILVEQTAVDLAIPCGYWRSVGSSHNAYVTECFFDEVAHAAAKDPYELRRGLLRDQPRHLGVRIVRGRSRRDLAHRRREVPRAPRRLRRRLRADRQPRHDRGPDAGRHRVRPERGALR
jgi:isoquinoline 1-oxidoreductase beta subunit